MYIVEHRFTETFTTYREAEIFCGEHGIHPEEIFFDEDWEG